MDDVPEKQWFELEEIRRRKLANAVWIPLRKSETIGRYGEPGRVGSWEETACVGSVAISLEHRAVGDRLGWTDIGLIHDARPFAFEDGRYKPADVYLDNDREAIGVELVLVQHLNGDHERRWLVNQDLVMALGLIEEGDVWKRADEGYEEVIRSRRDENGRIVAIEIRSEFLRDYLCARGLALRIAQYHQRQAILADPSYLAWPKSLTDIEQPGEHFTKRVFEVDTAGGPIGSVAVMKVWRTDIDKGEDAPVFGPESDANTDFESYTYQGIASSKAFRAEGELWREEWIEPAAFSERVRGNRPPDEFTFVVSAAGERLASSELNSEDVGRWLWFRPEVIDALLQFRGSDLEWYTRDTGSVKCSPDYKTHFGVDKFGCVNVYAYDIAKLPHWQQRVWVGHNIAPNGPVSSELLDSQMLAEPARTRAPEAEFAKVLHALDSLFLQQYGGRLFREHDNKAHVLARIHRFRAVEKGGIPALAKDVARLTADSLDVALLRRIVSPPDGTNWGSLKLMENALAAKVGADAARGAMTSLVAVYGLRLGDAHLPSSSIKEAYDLLGIDVSANPIDQAVRLLDQVVLSLRLAFEMSM